MEIRFHRRVQTDVNTALAYYRGISPDLAESFFLEFTAGIEKVVTNPRIGHFDACGLRRCNLERFPFHFLYDLRSGHIRVWVLRHDKREPGFGTARFK